MSVSAQKLPLSSVYLNLLQTRPVTSTAAAGRPATPASSGGSGDAATPANGTPDPVGAAGLPRNTPRGRFIDILA